MTSWKSRWPSEATRGPALLAGPSRFSHHLCCKKDLKYPPFPLLLSKGKAAGNGWCLLSAAASGPGAEWPSRPGPWCPSRELRHALPRSPRMKRGCRMGSGRPWELPFATWRARKERTQTRGLLRLLPTRLGPAIRRDPGPGLRWLPAPPIPSRASEGLPRCLDLSWTGRVFLPQAF